MKLHYSLTRLLSARLLETQAATMVFAAITPGVGVRSPTKSFLTSMWVPTLNERAHIKGVSLNRIFSRDNRRRRAPPDKRAGAAFSVRLIRALAPVAAVVVQRDADIGQERVLPTRLGWTRLSIEDVGPN